MHDPERVRPREPRRDLPRHPHRARRRERAGLQRRPQALPFDVLEHEKKAPSAVRPKSVAATTLG